LYSLPRPIRVSLPQPFFSPRSHLRSCSFLPLVVNRSTAIVAAFIV
jgi:hypothetical protein